MSFASQNIGRPVEYLVQELRHCLSLEKYIWLRTKWQKEELEGYGLQKPKKAYIWLW